MASGSRGCARHLSRDDVGYLAAIGRGISRLKKHQSSWNLRCPEKNACFQLSSSRSLTTRNPNKRKPLLNTARTRAGKGFGARKAAEGHLAKRLPDQDDTRSVPPVEIRVMTEISKAIALIRSDQCLASKMDFRTLNRLGNPRNEIASLGKDLQAPRESECRFQRPN